MEPASPSGWPNNIIDCVWLSCCPGNCTSRACPPAAANCINNRFNFERVSL